MYTGNPDRRTWTAELMLQQSSIAAPKGAAQRNRRTAKESSAPRLRQNLPEKQQQERHDHRLEKKLETGESEKRIDDLRREDNDTDIDQIIDYQNRSQQQIGLAQQIQHPPANRRIVPPDLAHIVARKRKKSVSEPETNAETNSRNKVTQHSTTT